MSKQISRRIFLKSGAAAAAVSAFPEIVPSSVFGANAPSNLITIGCIGVGRMAQGDMSSVIGFDDVKIVAVCDVDSNRANNARDKVNRKYGNNDCRVYGDFRDLLAQNDIDAVMIVTPDHWHALPAIQAAKAGKDIFVQKPMTRTIAEGRVLSDTVRKFERVLQVGSQQRSDSKFRLACELVRNERIGKLVSVKVGLPTDPGNDPQPVMKVPENLNYDMWLGPSPFAPYTEQRVHPQKGYGRPGWLRMRDYCAGMITGWGAHHMDIAHWGMGMENSGPIEIEGRGEYFTSGLWDVHGDFSIDYLYPDGVKLNCAAKNKIGVTFEGTDGWVYVTRGHIEANPASLLKTKFGPADIRLYNSNNHMRNWIDCIKTRKETVAPVENGHRSCTACLLGEIAMLTGRKLKWNPQAECFINDNEANRLRHISMSSPWMI